MQIRSPHRAPTVEFDDFANNPRSICFRHPAIPRAEGNLLFVLDGHDNADGLLHHETAWLACAIVAGNRWDGYLATSPAGPAIDVPKDGLLGEENYYFIVPHPDEGSSYQPSNQLRTPHEIPTIGGSASFPAQVQQQTQTQSSVYFYPIVPNFREWSFPNDKLPGSWSSLTKRRSATVASTTDAARLRDQSCRMTEAVEETDIAHIVPLAEETWFDNNDMIRYGNKHGSHNRGIDDSANTMLLRADLHRAFDKRRFTFLPKKELALVTHVFESESLRSFHHNVELNTTYIAPEYFFARFAWTIFPSVKQFLRRNRDRFLLVQDKPQWADPYQCLEYADPSKDKSESASPRKGSPRKSSPTKGRSPSKRPWEEMEAQAPNQDDGQKSQASGQGLRNMSLKRRRRQGNTVSPFSTSAPALPLPQSKSSGLPDGTEALGEPEARSFTLAPSHSLPISQAHHLDQVATTITTTHPEASINASTLDSPHPSTDEDDGQCWMTNRELRALTASQLLQERKRSDPHGHWEKEEAWLDGILRNGGALDRSEIKRWQYINGEEVDYGMIMTDG
ncbi:MAG: hypothetical protein Q9219_004791 [cf. Caloplaca sp. 3 TL-2023]